ncbi:hypothetical protein CDL15_Pgr012153 [Punica granatum]|uniref:Leucine-rich repeat-containing N-terminal plant-type domain-containing protein n=1 Tax=Punica granatum TaxID=22663 RepID=A0A218XLS2_PUNGR|nr:hypothetical protein CDL15_Pgr012153 [Punica granatum]
MRMRDVWVFPFLFLFSSAFPITLPLHSVSAAAVLTTSYRHYLSNIGECDALLQFSNSFNIKENAPGYYCVVLSSISSHPKTASWKNGTDCCSWDGVTCHIATNQVIGLDLACSWLRGPLHSNSTLFSLPSLQRLNLAGNDFYGSPISPSFGIFTGMTHLNLSYSQFSGPIPLDMISQLSSLITLDLSYINPLITIGDDHSLRRLVGNLTQLRELVLDGVGMSRISLVSLSNLSSTLTSLSLQQCSLTGTLPNNIFHLPRLRSLSLYANSDLIGSLPQTNWSTSSLVSLVLSDTKFHGPIPASVGNLTSMKILDLSYAKFTGPIPLTLGNLAHLTDLDLGSNTLGSTMEFEMFARLKSLQLLSLQYNNLSVLLQSNGNCSFPMLKVLMLSSCRLTGATFPYFLNSSAELEELDLSRNMISGGIPDWIGRVGRDTLALLDLSSNNFTREIPSSICQLSSLSDLDLFDNGFSGSIPRCIGNLSNLLKLDVSINSFAGEIPSSVCQESSIMVL